MMTDDALIERLSERARAERAPAPVTEAEIVAAETTLGFALAPLLRRILLEACNGGLFGLLAIRSAAHLPTEDDSIVVMREGLFDPAEDAPFLTRAVPFARPEYMEWSWVDEDGVVFTMVEGALFRAPPSFAEWLEAELAGRGHELLYERLPDREGVNPFTKERVVFRRFTPRGEKLYELPGDP